MLKTQAVSYTDHQGNAMNVHVLGRIALDSKTAMWDGASNEYEVRVLLTKVLT